MCAHCADSAHRVATRLGFTLERIPLVPQLRIGAASPPDQQSGRNGR